MDDLPNIGGSLRCRRTKLTINAHLPRGKRKAESGKRKAESGKRKAESGKRKAESGKATRSLACSGRLQSNQLWVPRRAYVSFLLLDWKEIRVVASCKGSSLAYDTN